MCGCPIAKDGLPKMMDMLVKHLLSGLQFRMSLVVSVLHLDESGIQVKMF